MSNALQAMLEASLEDLQLSDEERQKLQQLRRRHEDSEIRKLRNGAFDLAQEAMEGDPHVVRLVMTWLKRVLNALELETEVVASAHFSPGEDCRKAILGVCDRASRTLDICVFTISDNRIFNALQACHERGVKVRILTDNDKQWDKGSDIADLRRLGIPVRTDRSKACMHHKFALADGTWLLTGSFNWTNQATESNQENLIVTNHGGLVEGYVAVFEQLWEGFAPSLRNC